ncbi:MAG: hypothetical protein WCJ30_01440 [Deltaproteobacteria bacterium]
MRADDRRTAVVHTLVVTALAAVGAGACATERPPDRYRITFEVYSDLLPIPGALISVRTRQLATTDANGAARLELTGRDGVVIPVTVRCPAGTRGPENAIDVTLRTMQVIDQAAATRGIVQRVNCPPEDRTVAIVVRTNGKAGVPIMWQGREVSRTDGTGVASLTFRMHPQQQIQLALNTATEFADLRPQGPTRQFMVPDADDVFVWNQEFDVLAPPRVVRRRPPSTHAPSGGGGPHRIIRIR